MVSASWILPSGITSGKLVERSNGGAYSRRRRGIVGVGDGGASDGMYEGGKVIVADADLDRPCPRVVTKKRFLGGDAARGGLIGDRGEDLSEAGKSIWDGRTANGDGRAAGGNGFASGIGGGGDEKQVE